jgi:quercetin 2,3-dioxygenase
MSGPATAAAEAPLAAEHRSYECDMEVLEPRPADVGGFAVGRVLPVRTRRMVGPWCFVDNMGPGQVGPQQGLDVGPHPHIGLQTVTWLLAGALLHRDSLGSEQLVRPGQLNLMTAGRGVSHAEETREVHTGPLHGVQLWVAQPSATREGEPAFEHHPQLPAVALGPARATVFIGEFAGVRSPARRDTEHLGVELALPPGRTSVPLDPAFEHAVLALGRGVSVARCPLGPGRLGYLGTGRDAVVVEAAEDARVLLIGGAPFPERPMMWWNYVARTPEEIVAAHRDWRDGSPRFGRVASALPRITTGDPPPFTRRTT